MAHNLASTIARLTSLRSTNRYEANALWSHEDIDDIFIAVLNDFHHCNVSAADRNHIDWCIINQNLMGLEGPGYGYEKHTPNLNMDLDARLDLLYSLQVAGVGFFECNLQPCQGWDAKGSYYMVGYGLTEKIYADEDVCKTMVEELRRNK